MKDKPEEGVDVASMQAEVKEHFTQAEWLRAVDAVAQVHTLHLKFIDCESADCVVVQHIQAVGKYLCEIAEVCWPGMMKKEIEKLYTEVFATTTLEELEEKIKKFPMPEEHKAEVIEAARKLKARGEAEMEGDPQAALRKSLESRILKAVKDAEKQPVGAFPFQLPPSTKVH